MAAKSAGTPFARRTSAGWRRAKVSGLDVMYQCSATRTASLCASRRLDPRVKSTNLSKFLWRSPFSFAGCVFLVLVCTGVGKLRNLHREPVTSPAILSPSSFFAFFA